MEHVPRSRSDGVDGYQKRSAAPGVHRPRPRPLYDHRDLRHHAVCGRTRCGTGGWRPGDRAARLEHLLHDRTLRSDRLSRVFDIHVSRAFCVHDGIRNPSGIWNHAVQEPSSSGPLAHGDTHSAFFHGDNGIRHTRYTDQRHVRAARASLVPSYHGGPGLTDPDSPRGVLFRLDCDGGADPRTVSDSPRPGRFAVELPGDPSRHCRAIPEFRPTRPRARPHRHRGAVRNHKCDAG